MKIQKFALKRPFGGYDYARQSFAINEELQLVGPGTPGGEYLRRFWHPVAFTESIKDLPIKLRILGEDLVLFRDHGGRIGLLAANCPHRGTSLEFGIIRARGIMCCYHGWQIDVDGTILDTPNEPGSSRVKEGLCHAAYPVHEYQGLVFTYMGPPDAKPTFPIFEPFTLPGYRHVPWGRNILPCNWVQIKENCMDPVHTSFLHTIVSTTQFTEEFAFIPELEFVEVPNGMVYVATRRVADNVWVRMTNLIMPNIHQYGPTWESGHEPKRFVRAMQTHWAVPLDDTNTMNIGFNHYHETDPDPAVLDAGASFGQACDRPYEERQRVPGDYDAHSSIGPISPHGREHLCASDQGVAMFRRILGRAIKTVAKGEPLPKPDFGPRGEVLTYENNTIIRIPPKTGDDEADREMMRDIGRRVARAAVSRDWSNVPA